MKFEPRPYQIQAIDWGLTHPKCGLFLPMGAGKTVSTLEIITAARMLDISRVLIIGPVRVVESTWPEEIEKWDSTKNLSYELVTGQMAKGKKSIDLSKDIHLVGKENVIALVAQYRRKWPWDMIVIDELSAFKNPQAKRFKALKSIAAAATRLIALTGTPAPRGVPDLWSQIYLMDQGERLGKTLTAFRSEFLLPGRRNGQVIYEWTCKPGAQDQIFSRISDICMSIDQRDCVSLPPLTVLTRSISLGSAMRSYEDFRRTMVLRYGEDEAMLAANAGVLCGQLLQYTSGQIYRKNDMGETIGLLDLHAHKLNALDDLIEAANGQPVIVFYYFRHEYDRLMQHYSKSFRIREIKGQQDVKAWNAGEIDILLLHPASAGHGLNLQQGGNICIWYSLPNWNLELYQQANARLYRQGQKNPVTIYHIIARGTIDEDMMEALEKKNITQKSLLKALRKTNDRKH